MRISILGVLVLLIFMIERSHAGLSVVNMKVQPRSYVYQRVGIYEKNKIAFGGGQIDPYGVWDFDFVDVGGRANHSTEFLILKEEELRHLGVQHESRRYYCCSMTLFDMGLCTTPNYTIFQSDRLPSIPRDSLFYYNVTWARDDDGTSRGDFDSVRLNLTEGLWYLMTLNCGDTPYSMIGTSYWRNPYGHVLGQHIMMVYVNAVMMAVYALFLILWIILCIMNKDDLMGLQISIGIVVGVAFLQNTISFASMMKYNRDGLNSTVFNAFDAFLYTLKLTLSRLLLLLVCMGYTITKKKLTKVRVLVLGASLVLYFAAVATEVFLEVSRKDGTSISSVALSIISFFVVLTNGFIILWAVFELVKTINKLKNMNEDVKMRMYKKLAIILLVAFIISAILYIVQFGITVTGKLDSIWKGEFFFASYWEFAFFAITLGIAIIWRPTLDNKRFAYSMQLPDNDPGTTAEMSQISLEESEVQSKKKKNDEKEEEEEMEDTDEES